MLEVSGTLEVFPRRTIFVPASLLLPEVVPIRSTLLIGVKGPLDIGEVELVVAKWVSETMGRIWEGGGSKSGELDQVWLVLVKVVLQVCMLRCVQVGMSCPT